MSANIYGAIEEKGIKKGLAFILTNKGALIEADIYNGVIITLKSLRLSLDQICQVLASGEIKEMTFQNSAIKPETAQPNVVARTFPAAMAACAHNPSHCTPAKLLSIAEFMSCLAGTKKEGWPNTFTVMHQQIAKLRPGFLPDMDTVYTRIDRLHEEYGISRKILDARQFPQEIHAVPECVFRNLEPVNGSLMKNEVLHFIFFGEMSRKIIRASIEEEINIAAKEGHAVLSKTVYPGFQDTRTVKIFDGMHELGEINIDWSLSKKNTLLLTTIDLDKFGLEDGNNVNLIPGA